MYVVCFLCIRQDDFYTTLVRKRNDTIWIKWINQKFLQLRLWVLYALSPPKKQNTEMSRKLQVKGHKQSFLHILPCSLFVQVNQVTQNFLSPPVGDNQSCNLSFEDLIFWKIFSPS